MPYSKYLFGLISLIIFIVSSPKVWAQQYDEVTYDDLVNQLSRKKSQNANNSQSSFDSLMIHTGFGLITSVNSVHIENQDSLKYQNGFQLSLGIDLFSPQLMAEAAIRNFGQSNSGNESRSFREFDLKFIYQDYINNKTGFHAGAGLGTRYFKMTDSISGVSINDSTPTSVFIAGIDAPASKNLSVGIELGFRSAMVTTTADKNSLDMTFRLDTSF